MLAIAGEAARRYGEASPQYIAALREGFDRVARGQVIVGPNGSVEVPEPQVQTLDSDPRARNLYLKKLADLVTGARPRIVGPGSAPPRDSLGRPGMRETVAIMPAGGVVSGNLCSGVLISPTAVLTAAHCVCDLHLDTQAAEVVIGEDVNFAKRYPTIKVNQLYKKDFCGWTDAQKSQHLDLAVVFFKGPKDASSLQLAAPGAASFLPTQSEVWLAGFGRTRVNDPGSKGKLMVGQTFVVSPSCLDPDPSSYACIAGGETVLIGENGIDSCHGDSGGPAFVFDKKTSTYKLVGITRRGLTAGCGSGGVYGLVTQQVTTWYINVLMARAGGG